MTDRQAAAGGAVIGAGLFWLAGAFMLRGFGAWWLEPIPAAFGALSGMAAARLIRGVDRTPPPLKLPRWSGVWLGLLGAATGLLLSAPLALMALAYHWKDPLALYSPFWFSLLMGILGWAGSAALSRASRHRRSAR
jgi:hypothetical protein